MADNENLQILDEAKLQGDGHSMKDLVFNPATGEFDQVDKGRAPNTGTVVTDMTKDGFAA
ncbi:MAG: hypothetical protein IJT30_04055 [Muribaculaceae bacterium]|nr:hypothetical protein [Muribaculaceae bacterium]